MRLLLTDRKNEYFKTVLENVKEYKEDLNEQKVFVYYENSKENKNYSLIEYKIKKMTEEEFIEFANSSLDYLGGSLNSFYKEEVEDPNYPFHARISVYEGNKFIISGKASEIKEDLRDKFRRKILKYDAYFNDVTITI